MASAADLIAAALLRGDAVRPAAPAPCPQRPLRALQGPRRADSLRGLVGRRAWCRAAELLKLRELGNDLEGHPTPRLPFVDVATGSLGQGLAAGLGIALNATRIKSDYRTYVLMGDGETAEGSVWEAAESATHFGIDNLVGITDVNRLGQSRPTIWQHDLGALARRWSGFGWHTLQIDGHDFTEILDALAEARATKGRPTMILAKTFKGRGVSFAEDKDGWHGKAFKAGEEADRGRRRARGDVEAGRAGRDCRAAGVHPEAHDRGPGAEAAPGDPAAGVQAG